MVSRALAREVEVGSIQHWSLAQGEGLCTSGGSVPMLRARIRPTPTVFIRSLSRQVGVMEEEDWDGLLLLLLLLSFVCDCCWLLLLLLGGDGPMNVSPDADRGGD